MNNTDIKRIALRQSAVDLGCKAEDFLQPENKIVLSKAHPGARNYLTLPFACNLVSYGNNIVASVGEAYLDIVRKYIDKYDTEQCFVTPNLHVLDDALRKKGQRICYMAEYFLPDLSLLKERPCPYPVRILHNEDFADLYDGTWGNALCKKRKDQDVLGVGAYDGGMLIGLAGCSTDCDTMWQIGVDVLPGYRRKGIAAALCSRLALETLNLGKVPFYCAMWSNIGSVRNALACGFHPAWVEMTAKPEAYVEEVNGRL